MGRGFDDISPDNNKDDLKIDEIVDIHKFAGGGTYENFRFLPHPMLPVKTHWIKIMGGKEGNKREIKIPRLCVSFDPDNEKVPKKGTDCPYCKLSKGENGSQQEQTAYFINAIVRDHQENEPRKPKKPTAKEKKSGFKDRSSDSWTPVRVIRLTGGLATKIQKLKQRNKFKGEAYAVTHAKNGCDIGIAFDKDAKSAGDMYQIDRGERSPLTKEEQAYLIYDLSDDIYDMMGLKTQEAAEKDFADMDVIGHDQIDDDDDDDDAMSLGGSRKKKAAKKTTKKRKPSFDEDDYEDEDDDDEDDAPKKKKKSTVKKKTSTVKKKTSTTKKKKKSSDDEDDAPKKKKVVKKKKKSSDDDDAPKKKKVVKKKKKSSDDDEAPKKKKKRKTSF